MTTLETLKAARLALGEAYGDYSHPAFTDRRGTQYRLKDALTAVNEAIAKLEAA